MNVARGERQGNTENRNVAWEERKKTGMLEGKRVRERQKTGIFAGKKGRERQEKMLDNLASLYAVTSLSEMIYNYLYKFYILM